jgi:hypothetical protein
MDDSVEEIKADPSSVEEKNRQFKENNYIEKWLFLSELTEVLKNKKLKPTDWIQVNKIGNLTIMRQIDDDHFTMIAVIDFHRSAIEFYL